MPQITIAPEILVRVDLADPRGGVWQLESLETEIPHILQGLFHVDPNVGFPRDRGKMREIRGEDARDNAESSLTPHLLPNVPEYFSYLDVLV